MVPAHPLIRAVVVAGLVVLGALLGACGGEDDGDPVAFCEAYDDLSSENPFADLLVASPAEMRTAFDDLQQGAAALAEDAPADVDLQADRYRTAVDDLVDQLRGAGYDLRSLDRAAYRQATDAYNQAAVSLENAAGAACP